MNTFTIGLCFFALSFFVIRPSYGQEAEEVPLHDHGHVGDHGHEMDEIFVTASPHKKKQTGRSSG